MRKDPAPSLQRPFWARLGMLLCLLAWFLATPLLLPAMVAGLGALDGKHRVSLAGRDGQVAVIFHHQREGAAAAHSHTPLARLLTVLAQSRGATQDHVLTFAQNAETCAGVRSTQPTAPAAALAPRVEVAFSFPAPAFPAVASRAPCPSSARGFTLVCLRSTLLLI